MRDHIIAIATYGSQRVKHPRTKQRISAYKMGYTSAASIVLLALYGDQARDVSSKQASYHYVQVDADVIVRHGYILLKVSDTDLARTTGLTRQCHRAGVYLWQDTGWQELPSLRNTDFVSAQHGPNFNPTGLLIVSASTGEAESAIAGITVEKRQRSEYDTPWWWLRGDTYPHRETLKRWGCRWSKRQKAWYFIGATLPDAIQHLLEQVNIPPDNEVSEDDYEPCSLEEASAVLGVPLRDASAPDDITTSEPADVPPIRIIKPEFDEGEPDTIITAIRQTRVDELPVLRTSSKITGRRQLTHIPQAPCGELTGSITGNVWCYGFAVHDGVCVYVNFGGPRMAVEAIRARFSKGEIVNCVPWDAPTIELTAGEGNMGMYSAFMQNIPEAKFTSLILLHELLTQPNYGGKSTTFIFHLSDEQAMSQLKHHVTELVNVPVFNHWSGYLWQAGQSAMLIRKTRGAGGLDVLAVDLDVDAWTRLITGGLAQGIVMLPTLLKP